MRGVCAGYWPVESLCVLTVFLYIEILFFIYLYLYVNKGLIVISFLQLSFRTSRVISIKHFFSTAYSQTATL